MSSTFKGSLSITHIGTATAILELDNVNLLTDPFFSPVGTEWDIGVATLKNTDSPAMGLQDLPVIDAVLLSHEDHPDNLDNYGRQLLDGRHVLTTMDGAAKLSPRSGVRGLKPWETIDLAIGGRVFQVTGTPCDHVPGGECTGFLITTLNSEGGQGFGTTDGLPNAIYFSGDTVYMSELPEKIRNRFHVSVALLNLGAAKVALGPEPLQVTMDGKQAARLVRELGADVVVPMHYESWRHFTQNGDALAEAFREEKVENVIWLEPGKSKKII